ncbi:MAG: GTP-binding protein [Bdellovibrionota bacterium]
MKTDRKKKTGSRVALRGTRAAVVFVGHVDHGKSTIIGRLLAECGAIAEEKIAAVRHFCERTSRPLEHAFLLDTLSEERNQGVTIDAAKFVLRRKGREIAITDAPGHLDFLRNMASGASHGDAAFLVVDATEGFQANTRCHMQLLSLLGIECVALLVNKMDLTDYRQEVFEQVRAEFLKLAKLSHLRSLGEIPVSAAEGANLVRSSKKFVWYDGCTVLQALENVRPVERFANAPFRMFVQDVYKFTKRRDYRRIIAGTVESGSLSVGDTILFSPSGKRSLVQRIESTDNTIPQSVESGTAIGFTLAEPIYVSRGQVISRVDELQPKVSTVLEASVFWLDDRRLSVDEDVVVQLGTNKAAARIETFKHVVRMADGQVAEGRNHLERGELGQCVVRLKSPLAFDERSAGTSASRFAIIRNCCIGGGGIVERSGSEVSSRVQEQLTKRHAKWENSMIAREYRAQRYGQKAALVLITGPASSERKQLAKVVEAKLFSDGRAVYYLGFGSVLYGIDADLDRSTLSNEEHVRRFGEVANIMLDAGLILLASAAEMTRKDIELLRSVVDFQEVLVVWYGELAEKDLQPELHLTDSADLAQGVEAVRSLLEQRKIIFCPW